MRSIAKTIAQSPVRSPNSGLARLILTGMPLSSGVALIGFIVFGVPMVAAVVVLCATGAITWALVLPRLTDEARTEIKRRVHLGAMVGLPAIAAYDATRYGLVAIMSMSFGPFHVFPLFGYALIGPDISEFGAAVIGLGFHVVNGLGFAIAFALAVPRPAVWLGIAWALILETFMLLLYPGWLGVSLASELLPVSLAGHLAYGSVLGFSLSRLMR